MATLGLHPIPCQTISPSQHESSMLCSSKGSYELMNAVSRGSYDIVYRARDTKTGRIVAVKLEFHGLSQTTLRETTSAGHMQGRPKQKRIRSVTEPCGPSHPSKLSRKMKIQTCRICNLRGHKKGTCPNKGKPEAYIREDREEQPALSSHVGGLRCEISVTKNTSRDQSLRSARSVARTYARRSKTSSSIPAGIGLYVNSNTGTTTMNPGTSSERIISQQEHGLHDDTDPIRFAIPNERQVKKSLTDATSNQVIRQVIPFTQGDSTQIRFAPSDLPFQPPGLMWNGISSISARQLLRQVERRMTSIGQSSQESVVESTSTRFE